MLKDVVVGLFVCNGNIECRNPLWVGSNFTSLHHLVVDCFPLTAFIVAEVVVLCQFLHNQCKFCDILI